VGSEVESIAARLAGFQTDGSISGQPSPEAYLANLSDENVIITALLPADATGHRNLLLGILDRDDLTRLEAVFALQSLNRERVLAPGEVLQITLRKLAGRHLSLFRVRKEKSAISSFAKYSVGTDGRATLTPLGPREPGDRLETHDPNLLYLT
jgi:hypothetical protein